MKPKPMEVTVELVPGAALDRLSVVVDALAAAVDDLAELLGPPKAWPTTNEEATG